VNAHNVLVRQLQAAPRFPLQLTQQRPIQRDEIRQELERHIAFQFFVMRQPDNSHPAPAKDLSERVATEDSLFGSELAERRFGGHERHLSQSIGRTEASRQRVALSLEAIL